MKSIRLIKWAAIFLLLFTLNFHLASARAQGTAFTYQGRLEDGGAPANGSYDFRFRLASDPLANNYLGSAYLTNGVAVNNGLFTTTLDFGPGLFNGSNCWLEVDVRTNGGAAYAVLSPLQAVTPSPYAIFAGNVAAGGLPAGAYGSAVIFSNNSNQFTGAFTGNGTNLSNVNAVTVGGLNAGNLWQLGGNTVAGGQFLGSLNNQAVEIWADQSRAFRLEPDPNGYGAPNVIGGAPNNFVDSGVIGATIAGGGVLNFAASGAYEPGPGPNHVSAPWGAIGGGRLNTVAGDHGTIGGGHDNLVGANANDAVIGGGDFNMISNSTESVIGGGYENMVQTNDRGSTIAGGEWNAIQSGAYDGAIGGGYANTLQANSDYSTVSGGIGNSAGSSEATLGGGGYNSIGANAGSGTIGGGYNNTLQIGAYESTIGGGYNNILKTNAYSATIAGGSSNAGGSPYGTVGGGGYNAFGSNANSGTISGGFSNEIGDNTHDSTISGGSFGSIGAYGFAATIAGGSHNTILNGALEAVIGGGTNNLASGIEATVSGGGMNTAGDYGTTVGGGIGNVAAVDGATIGGGANNIAANTYATVAGGAGNAAGGGLYYYAGSTIGGGENNVSSNDFTTVGGGLYNRASGYAATIPGGDSNLATNSETFAAGHAAQAMHDGAFVWADDQAGTPFASTGKNQFSARATGGVRFVSAIDGSGNPTAGVSLAPGSGSWTSLSDRNAKENFAPVNAQAVLARVAALPLSTWNYKSEPAAIRHLGPMAQDFKAAFKIGESDTGITAVDAEGIALAAIQGLNQKIEEKDSQLQKLRTQNEILEKRLEVLEQTVKASLGRK